ncbi:MAG: SLC13 family permease [Pseudomonadales bacterium]|nr:SLC13 family permease [Pseudomonadales bacterium]
MDANRVRIFALWGGPGLAVAVALTMLHWQWSAASALVAAITMLCAVWWVFEAIPIPATSLIPLAIFPLFDVLSHAEVAESYGNPLILLLLGGFILSTAMSKNGAHRRVALGMVNLFGGTNNHRILFGFMAASALLSMWISNTATTLMLLPVALATLESAKNKQLVVPLLLGICYAASVGGMGTPIGTPPNLIFMKVYSESSGVELSFLDWMKWGLPVVICFIPIIAWWLTRNMETEQNIDIPPMGRWQKAEVRVLLLFGLTAITWITRKEPFGGWSEWLSLPNANDATVALSAVVLMFIVSNGKGGRLLDWESANEIPWGMLLLFGGGIALAKAFSRVGLSEAVADQLVGLSALPVILLLLSVCLVVTFMTEMTSNTATTTLLMPILAAAAVATKIEPALLMVPAAMSASCAFMLPVATAPNAIIFGSGKVSIREMARHGFAINLIGAVIISGICYIII